VKTMGCVLCVFPNVSLALARAADQATKPRKAVDLQAFREALWWTRPPTPSLPWRLDPRCYVFREARSFAGFPLQVGWFLCLPLPSFEGP
jgi:hypothetical protein